MNRLRTGAAALLFLLFPLCPAHAKDIGYSLELAEPRDAGEYPLKDGVIRVTQKGAAIEGFQLIVPPGAYDGTQIFTVQYRKVKSSNVPDYVLSPLISVSGPRVAANGFLIVKIPCRVPENSSALVFFYDDKDKFTEALPPGPKESGYVTAMTRQLKDMVVVASKVPKPAVKDNGKR